MLTTRVSGSLGSALQMSPKENMTHCSGTFFFNHPCCTVVGEFRCDERKISHSISRPQIYEVWCLCFKIGLVQISLTN